MDSKAPILIGLIESICFNGIIQPGINLIYNSDNFPTEAASKKAHIPCLFQSAKAIISPPPFSMFEFCNHLFESYNFILVVVL